MSFFGSVGFIQWNEQEVNDELDFFRRCKMKSQVLLQCCTMHASLLTVDSKCRMRFHGCCCLSDKEKQNNSISRTRSDSLSPKSPFNFAPPSQLYFDSPVINPNRRWLTRWFSLSSFFPSKSASIIYGAHLSHTISPEAPFQRVQLSAVKMNSFCFCALMQCWQESLWYTWEYEISIRRVFFFPLSLSRGFIFEDIGSCHFATPCDMGDTQLIWQVLDSRHTPRRAGNISSGKVP